MAFIGHSFVICQKRKVSGLFSFVKSKNWIHLLITLLLLFLFDCMSYILGLCVCAHICAHICIRICLPDRESTSRGRQGAPSWSPPSLNSKLSQFSTDPLPRSRTLPCSQNWIQIYTKGWRGGGFHIPQNGTQDLLCTSSMHLTFNRIILRIFCLYFSIFVLYCSGLAPCGGLNPADCRWH